MVFEVELHAFGSGGEIRKVHVPDELLERYSEVSTIKLELIFGYGQNEYQHKQERSVSVGDVIRFQRKRHLISAVGFVEIPPDYVPTSNDWLLPKLLSKKIPPHE